MLFCKKNTYTDEECALISEFRKGKDALLNYVMKEYFTCITIHDIIDEPSAGTFIMRGEKVPIEIIRSYASEAKAILSMEFWKELMNSIRYEAAKVMYEKSLSYDDVRGGKFMLYTIELINKKLLRISSKYDILGKTENEEKIVKMYKDREVKK